MSGQLKQNLSARATWMRLLYMALFVLLYGVAELVIGAVVVLQAVRVLIQGRPNPRLLEFGQAASAYIYQLLRYLTFNSDVLPFPFGEWPDASGMPDGK